MKRVLPVLMLLASSSFMLAQIEIVPTNTTANFYDVDFPSQNVGYIVGDSSQVLKSTDGGNTWAEIQLQEMYELIAVDFVSEEKGWVIGRSFANAQETLLYTENGGADWSEVLIPSFTNHQSLVFLDDQTGFIGGQGYLLKTHDGGQSWMETEVTGEAGFSLVNAIRFLDAEIGFAVQQQSVFKSTDGGDSWELLARFDETNLGLNSVLTDVFFLDENRGFMVGWYNSAFLRTTDGGASWTDLREDLGPGLYGLFFLNNTYGYAFGASDGCFRTVDGGETWTVFPLPAHPIFPTIYEDGHFFNTERGIVVGTTGMVVKVGTFVTSTNNVNSEDSFTIFPNPTNDFISWPAHLEVERVTLFDINGRALKTWDSITANSLALPAGITPVGEYLMQFTLAGDQIVHRKLIIH